jgi:hypothetical protein
LADRFSKGPTPKAAPTSSPAPKKQDTPANPDDVDAREVARVLRAYDGIVQAINDADWKKAGCHDRTKGFDALLQCETEVRDIIVKSVSGKPQSETSTAPCARIVELGYRKYIERQSVYHENFVRWLESNRKKLSAPMASHSLLEACGKSDALCKGKPYDFTFEAQYYDNIGKIECTKSLFVCGTNDDVCTINKVTNRLGLGRDKPSRDGLFVRSTGTRIR